MRRLVVPYAPAFAAFISLGLAACGPAEVQQPDASVPADLAQMPPAPDLSAVADLATPPPPPPDMTQVAMCSTCHITQWGLTQNGRHSKLGEACITCHKDALAHQADPSKVRAAIDFSVDGCGAGECHKDYKDSMLKDDGVKAGAFGGSIKTSKYLEFPKYQHLMGGHGFTIEYNEERAHSSMLKDHYDIKRKQNTACLQCKSTPVTLWWNETRRGQPVFGKDVEWSAAIQRIKDNWPGTIDYGAGCSHCHDPHSTGFRVIRKGVINAVLERGTDPYAPNFNSVPKTPTELTAKMNERGMDGKLTVNARRLAGTLTCAQCHIEYTCGPGADKNVLRDDVPWRKLRDLESYYKVKYNLQQDWTHSTTQTVGIKAQHPETEFYWESKHYKSGVSCADCHMSKSGNKTSHWFTSPLKLPKDACENCHPGEVPQRLAQVAQAQSDFMKKASKVEADLDVVLTKIESNPQIDPAKMTEAKERYMRALFWWEFTAVSENSAGFHNVTEGMTNLGVAESEAAAARGLLGM